MIWKGKNAIKKALDAKALRLSDVNSCVVPNLKESELEDLYDVSVYRDAFQSEFGVDPKAKLSGKQQKWSAQVQRRFTAAGKPWDGSIKAQVKERLSIFAEANHDEIIRSELSAPLDSFIHSAEAKLPKNI